MHNKHFHLTIIFVVILLVFNILFLPASLTLLLILQLFVGIIHIFGSIDLYYRVAHIKSLLYSLQNYWMAVSGFFVLSSLWLIVSEWKLDDFTIPVIWFIGVPWAIGFYYSSIVATYHDFKKQ